MTPQDPRHGTYAGTVEHYKRGETPCPPCAVAGSRYGKRRKYEAHHGRPRLVPILGFRRRVEALQAIGYSMSHIARALGISNGTMSNRFYRSEWISRTNHAHMATVYEALCMTPHPFEVRTIRNARARGYAPPLAWNNIDDPEEHPRGMSTDPHGIDRVVVERILAGDHRLPATKAERLEVIARWTGSRNELARVTGWNVARDLRDGRVAS